MAYQLLSPVTGVTHLVFDTMRELTLSMFRIEEFYESPYSNIKGQYFSVDQFLETYSDPDGDIEYFRYWDGFNVPIESLSEFERLFTPHGLTAREQVILDLVRQHKTRYLIATCKDTDESTVDHEIAHARWTVDPAYRERCRKALACLTDKARQAVVKALLKADYPDDEAIMEDEIHAYLKTDTKKSLKKMLKSANPEEWNSCQQVRKLLQKVV